MTETPASPTESDPFSFTIEKTMEWFDEAYDFVRSRRRPGDPWVYHAALNPVHGVASVAILFPMPFHLAEFLFGGVSHPCTDKYPHPYTCELGNQGCFLIALAPGTEIDGQIQEAGRATATALWGNVLKNPAQVTAARTPAPAKTGAEPRVLVAVFPVGHS